MQDGAAEGDQGDESLLRDINDYWDACMNSGLGPDTLVPTGEDQSRQQQQESSASPETQGMLLCIVKCTHLGDCTQIVPIWMPCQKATGPSSTLHNNDFPDNRVCHLILVNFWRLVWHTLLLLCCEESLHEL